MEPMSKNLLIVESPAKARTIKKYLGPDFRIMASVGHLKDLPVKRLGVDLENNFDPEYVTIKGKGKILNDLKKAGREAEAIYLAPDPDREGEAIAWHIAQELKGGGVKVFRVLFNELTAKAIREAVVSPQALNMAKFESQQARRILDRLVGYLISPLLWSRVRGGLSAGRVQSVALRMICDREREIHAFEPQEYWSLTARLESEEPPPFEARLVRYEGKKIDLKTQEQTQDIISHVEDRTFKVAEVSKKKKRKNPPPPFITSLLQQEAYGRLGFSAKKTMFLAQNLYEGIDLGERGQIGLITYMRTDSFRLSDDAVFQARDFIQQAFGKDYVPTKPNRFKSRQGAQEAHEAIRPTSVELDPQILSSYLTKDQLSLYTLIWKRFVACQMKSAVLDQTQVDIIVGKATFKASGSVVVFKGFTALYVESSNNSGSERNGEGHFPSLKKGQPLHLIKLEPAQHFTQPPPRFSEATLIKALEENGIGRPSTYATILANITEREYVSIEKRRFKPTELGFLIAELLVQNFPDIFDTTFTALMESNLDKIERGAVKWTRVVEEFYKPFEKDLKKARQEMRGEALTDITCAECNRSMAIKSGKNGLFLACTGFPECKSTANFTRDDKGRIVVEVSPELGKEQGTCESCDRPMVVKNGKFGSFLACSGYPECRHTRAIGQDASAGLKSEPTEVRCNACGAMMVVKVNRTGQRFLACENYPTCTHTEPLSTDVPCPKEDCQGTLVERVSKKGRKFYACNQYPKCRFAMWDEPFDEVCPECGNQVLSVKRRKGAEPILVCPRKGCGFTMPLPVASAD
jgi:DNA topoisomerase-1